MVYVVNDGGQIIACGSRDNDLAGASFDMSLSFSLRGVETGALEDYVNAQCAPGALSSVLMA